MSSDRQKNKIISFNIDWNTSDINKEKILIVNNLYTYLLEIILEKEENINVILDSDKSICTVYINGKYITIDKNIIVKETMKKLNKHLIDFLEDKKGILNSRIIDVIKDTIDQKYNKYLQDIDIQKNVNDFICIIYENTMEKALKNYNNIKN